MYCQLRERETNTFFIEYSINSLIHVEINAPVISAVHPHADNNIHTAGIQSMKCYKRLRSIQYTLISS